MPVVNLLCRFYLDFRQLLNLLCRFCSESVNYLIYFVGFVGNPSITEFTLYVLLGIRQLLIYFVGFVGNPSVFGYVAVASVNSLKASLKPFPFSKTFTSVPLP